MFSKNTHFHFIGIAGIGMSGIAKILRLQGYQVSGCDAAASGSTLLASLEKIGCTIHHGHNPDHLQNIDVLVYSSAISKQNEEYKAAVEKNIPLVHRGHILAELMRSKDSIAVSGTHGKTTTTSLVSHILIQAHVDPTIIVGGIVKNMQSNAHLGNSNWLIAEADESDRSLLLLDRTIAVITNVDTDHLDTYNDLEDIKQTFKQFLARLPFYGTAILCADDANTLSLLPLSHTKVITYGLDRDANIRGSIISLDAQTSRFEVYKNKKLLGSIDLSIPGEHNILNALAAITVSLELDISFEIIQQALASFAGVDRRFEFKGTIEGIEVFDDYGHHPLEVSKTLITARNRAKKKLHVVFQPHRFTRTQKLWDAFVETLATRDVDTLYIPDIYPASEQPLDGITSENLISAIKKINPSCEAYYFDSFQAITKHIHKTAQQDDLVITVGAGDVYQVGEQLLNMHKT